MGGSRGGNNNSQAQAQARAREQQAAALRAQQAAAAAQSAEIARAQAAAAQKAEADRIASEAAAAQAALNTQNMDSYNAMNRSFGTATQGALQRLERESLSEDMARQAQQSSQYASAGGASSGAGFDLGSIRQQALSNLGVTSPAAMGVGVAGAASTNNNLPANAPMGNIGAMITSNMTGGGSNNPNNSFQPPNASKLAFGGS
jgi:hypothetical protein